MSATASDADGSVTKVEFFAGTVKIGEDTEAPYEAVWSNPPVADAKAGAGNAGDAAGGSK